MSFWGKLHEISLYGLISAVVGLASGKTTLSALYEAGFHVSGFSGLFLAFMFWASVAFIPVAIVGCFATKYSDGGEGLTFQSNNLFVIFFAHIAEEILGLVTTPFWFLKDAFTHGLNDGWKIVDYITYFLEIVFIVLGFVMIW